MLYMEIIAVCSENHAKHTNTLCGQNVELPNVKPAVLIVTTGLYSSNNTYKINIPNVRSDKDKYNACSVVPRHWHYGGY